jgi:hypothetical protein
MGSIRLATRLPLLSMRVRSCLVAVPPIVMLLAATNALPPVEKPLPVMAMLWLGTTVLGVTVTAGGCWADARGGPAGTAMARTVAASRARTVALVIFGKGTPSPSSSPIQGEGF